MKRKKSNLIADLFLYNGLSKEEYEETKPSIYNRNKRTLNISSMFVSVFAVAFLIINIFTGSANLLPYIFLAVGGLFIYVLNRFQTKHNWYLLILCYGLMAIVFVYSGILSFQLSNISIPATSFVVFIAVMPLTIDDRPVRMIPFVLIFAATFLVVSYFKKASNIFRLDLMNVLTFALVGLVLYFFICRRNVRELFESIRVEKLQKDIISSFATVIEERDEKTGEHIIRTEDYVVGLLNEMVESGLYPELTPEYCDNVKRAAPMHDIGKIKIPDSVLNKPGRFNDQEYEIMKKHAEYGAKIIEKTFLNAEERDYFDVARNLTLYHHERFDGNGYPRGLEGEDIPLEARIMALADVYDALVSERVYKRAYTKEEATRLLLEGKGSQFDPVLVDLFLKSIEKL